MVNSRTQNSVQKNKKGTALILEDSSLLASEVEALKLELEEVKAFQEILGHDLRSPLRHVLNLCAIIELKLDDPVEIYERVKSMSAVAKKAYSFVEDLSLLTRLERNKLVPETFELEPLLGDVLNTHFDAINDKSGVVQITAEADVVGVKSFVWAMFDNFIRNSLVHGATPLEVEISFKRENGRQEFCFSNNTKEILSGGDHLFKRYVTTTGNSTKSSGLGLFIIKKIIEAHNGEIEVIVDGNRINFHFYFNV